MHWHTLDIDKIFSQTRSSLKGLAKNEIDKRQEEFGRNVLEEKKKKPLWQLFLQQFADFMILVLVAAAIISGVAGDLTDMFIILVIILLNAIVGFVQEYRAEKAMEALKKMASASAVAIRNGDTTNIPAEEKGHHLIVKPFVWFY